MPGTNSAHPSSEKRHRVYDALLQPQVKIAKIFMNGAKNIHRPLKHAILTKGKDAYSVGTLFVPAKEALKGLEQVEHFLVEQLGTLGLRITTGGAIVRALSDPSPLIRTACARLRHGCGNRNTTAEVP